MNSVFEHVQFKRYIKCLNESSWTHKSGRKRIPDWREKW